MQEDLLINSFTSLNESPLSNMFDDFRKMRDVGKLLTFRGVLTSETITALLRFAEVRLAATELPLKKKKVVINVLIECLQNVIYHTRNQSSEQGANECLFEISSENQNLQVRIGNFVKQAETDALLAKLNHYNSLDKAGLHQTYLEILEKGEISDRGGAGLGLLRMLRETGNPLQWHIQYANEGYSFFALQVNI